MRKKVLKKKSDMSSTTKNIVGILLSAVCGAIFSVILTFIFSYIFTNAEIISKSVNAIFVGCVLLGGFFCGIFSSRLAALKGIISGIISSLIYSLIITVIMLFFAEGKLSASTLFLYIGTVVVSAIGGICGANIKRRK